MQIESLIASGTPASGPRTDPRPVVAVNNLRVHFGVKAGVVEAVDGVNFEYAAKLTGVNAISLAGLAWAPPRKRSIRWSQREKRSAC